MILYVHENCSKSAGASALLEERNIAFERRNYLTDPLSGHELANLLEVIDGRPCDLVRGAVDDTRVAVVAHLLAHPEAMQRPVAVHDGRAVIARPPERVLDLLGEGR